MTGEKPKKGFFDISDQQVEIIIGMLLRIGVILSAAVVIIGTIVFFTQHHNGIHSFHTFTGEPEALRNVIEIVSGAFQLNGLAIIQLGILLLIATPIARVIFALGAFFLEKDMMYVFITFIVLCILLYSLSGG